MLNTKWPRWIFASFSKWFYDSRNGIDFFVEGEDQKVENLSTYFEFRMNGPLMTEISKDFWRLEAVVNILVTTKQNLTNIHTHHTNVGIAASGFTKCVPMYEYGDNDTTQFGVMELKKQDNENIVITHLGQVNPDIKAMQSMVQGYYCMLLEV